MYVSSQSHYLFPPENNLNIKRSDPKKQKQKKNLKTITNYFLFRQTQNSLQNLLTFSSLERIQLSEYTKLRKGREDQNAPQ